MAERLRRRIVLTKYRVGNGGGCLNRHQGRRDRPGTHTMQNHRLIPAILRVAAAVVALVAASGAVLAAELAQRSTTEHGVDVRAKPVDVAPTAKTWRFEIILDTHSAVLIDDLRSTATLAGAKGAPQAALSWAGDPPGGHHRKGVLRFAPIAPRPDVIELKILRPGETAPRTFRWEIK